MRNRAPCSDSAFAIRVIATSLFCLLLYGCGKEEAPVEVAVPRQVKTIVLTDSGDSVWRQYPGRVRAARRTDLSFEVGGKLVELPAIEGDGIEKGDLVARLDDRDLVNNMKSANAEAENAAANFLRGSQLIKDGFISRTAFDKMRAQRDMTAADLAKAQKAVEDTSLLAPFSGRVAIRYVENFQDVKALQPIISLQDIKELEILINMPENRAMGAGKAGKERSKLYAVFETLKERRFPLEIKEFSTEADPNTQTFLVVLSMPQPDGQIILPGMTAMVWEELPKKAAADEETRFLIPAAALFADPAGAPHVWIVDTQTNTVQQRAVETGELRGTDEIQVTGGLKAGEMLAVTAVSRLREGMAILPVAKVEFR